jgi:hypothetical protein
MRSEAPPPRRTGWVTTTGRAASCTRDADPLLTEIFAVIEPAVLRKNGQPFEALGYNQASSSTSRGTPTRCRRRSTTRAGDPRHGGADHLPEPERSGSGVAFLHAYQPAIVLGASALGLGDPHAGRRVHRRAPPHLLPAGPLPPPPRAHGHRPPRVAVRRHQDDHPGLPRRQGARGPGPRRTSP